ncbi:hypothetical protein SBA6_650014 [Candidatus Sulfopaludibacter sp. SbA6]|nr:hypothetical protein SBA6_650014 [Candidatus Sulfopaludibacter sp. SbA6]
MEATRHKVGGGGYGRGQGGRETQETQKSTVHRVLFGGL